MKSYLKIYGPPVLKAIRALENVAIDMPEVFYRDPTLEIGTIEMCEDVYGYSFGQLPKSYYKIISKSGQKAGEYDFYFEWFRDPSQAELNGLIGKIDDALTPLGCKYVITTKRR